MTVYEFLKQEPLPGGYHENKKFIQVVRDAYGEIVDEEVRTAMGLVDEKAYAELLGRYITHISHWTKKEKLRNLQTGRLEDPDQEMMAEVERTISVMSGGDAKPEDLRHEIISRIGAWSIENPGKRPDYAQVFPRHLQALRESYFAERKKLLKKTQEDALLYLAEGPERGRMILGAEAADRVELMLRNLETRYGYNKDSARDAVSFLLRRKYA